jgi:hypothetical protein
MYYARNAHAAVPATNDPKRYIFSPDWCDFSVTFPSSPTITPVKVPPFTGLKAELILPASNCVLRAYALQSPGNNMNTVNEALLFSFLEHEAKVYGLSIDDMGIKHDEGRLYGYPHTHKMMNKDGTQVQVNWYLQTHVGPNSIFSTQTATLQNSDAGGLPFTFYNSVKQKQ